MKNLEQMRIKHRTSRVLANEKTCQTLNELKNAKENFENLQIFPEAEFYQINTRAEKALITQPEPGQPGH